MAKMQTSTSRDLQYYTLVVNGSRLDPQLIEGGLNQLKSETKSDLVIYTGTTSDFYRAIREREAKIRHQISLDIGKDSQFTQGSMNKMAKEAVTMAAMVEAILKYTTEMEPGSPNMKRGFVYTFCFKRLLEDLLDVIYFMEDVNEDLTYEDKAEFTGNDGHIPNVDQYVQVLHFPELSTESTK